MMLLLFIVIVGGYFLLMFSLSRKDKKTVKGQESALSQMNIAAMNLWSSLSKDEQDTFLEFKTLADQEEFLRKKNMSEHTTNQLIVTLANNNTILYGSGPGYDFVDPIDAMRQRKAAETATQGAPEASESDDESVDGFVDAGAVSAAPERTSREARRWSSRWRSSSVQGRVLRSRVISTEKEIMWYPKGSRN